MERSEKGTGHGRRDLIRKEHAPIVEQAEVSNPPKLDLQLELAMRERRICDDIKNEIISIPRIKREFEKAELHSPGITQSVPPSTAVDLIMGRIISKQAGRGRSHTPGCPMLQKVAPAGERRFQYIRVLIPTYAPKIYK